MARKDEQDQFNKAGSGGRGRSREREQRITTQTGACLETNTEINRKWAERKRNTGLPGWLARKLGVESG